MKGWKEATKVFMGAPTGFEHKCPFCGHINHSLNSIHLCGGCHTTWKRARGNKVNFWYKEKGK